MSATQSLAGRAIGVRWSDGVGGVESGELSLLGIVIRTGRPLPIGSRLLAKLVLAGGESQLSLPAEVTSLAPVANDPAKRFDLDVCFDPVDLQQFAKLTELAVVLAAGRGGIVLAPAPAATPGSSPSPLLARIEELERQVDRLLASIETREGARLESERVTAESLGRFEVRVANLERDSGRAAQLAGGGETLTTQVSLTQAVPRRRTTAFSASPPAPAKIELLEPAEFSTFLQAGQPISRVPRFNQFSPTNPLEALVAGWLESASDWDALRQVSKGQMAEPKLLELLQLFYRRGLIDFE